MAESTTCTHCGRLFDDNEELEDHLRSAHGASVKSGVEPRAEEELAEPKRDR